MFRGSLPTYIFRHFARNSFEKYLQQFFQGWLQNILPSEMYLFKYSCRNYFNDSEIPPVCPVKTSLETFYKNCYKNFPRFPSNVSHTNLLEIHPGVSSSYSSRTRIPWGISQGFLQILLQILLQIFISKNFSRNFYRAISRSSSWYYPVISAETLQGYKRHFLFKNLLKRKLKKKESHGAPRYS